MATAMAQGNAAGKRARFLRPVFPLRCSLDKGVEEKPEFHSGTTFGERKRWGGHLGGGGGGGQKMLQTALSKSRPTGKQRGLPWAFPAGSTPHLTLGGRVRPCTRRKPHTYGGAGHRAPVGGTKKGSGPPPRCTAGSPARSTRAAGPTGPPTHAPKMNHRLARARARAWETHRD